MAVNAAIEQTKTTTGFALLPVCHAAHRGAYGAYGQMVADQGTAMLAIGNGNVTGRPALFARGSGADCNMTTNLFCFAARFSDGRPPILLVDFATSSMALNKAQAIMVTRKQRGRARIID